MSAQRKLGLLSVFVLLCILWLANQFSQSAWLEARRWGGELEALGTQGVLLLWLAGALATAIGLPRQLLAFIAGFAWGVWPGLLLSLSAAVVGCALAWLAASTWLSGPVRRRYPSQVETLQRFLSDDLFLKVVALRLQPFGTNLLTNVVAGTLRVNLVAFLAGSVVGYIPQMLVFSLLGSGLRLGSGIRLQVSLALMVISLTLGGWLYRRYRRKPSG